MSGDIFAIDVGGTFTDLVILDRASGTVRYEKAPTTPDDPARGVRDVLAKSRFDLDAAAKFVHGTTLGLNMLLENTGSPVGLITTRGCRDVLELRRQQGLERMFEIPMPQPLIPRYLRREVPERMRADGVEIEPLDEDAVRREAAYLVAEGLNSIVVCFMHAYAHPQHELRAREVIAAEHPDVLVTLSHEITREYREYERMTTAVGDAAVKPRMRAYLQNLGDNLATDGFDGSFVLTRCDGGVMSVREAIDRPIRTLLSGPASGVIGVATLAELLELPRVIGADMGGTSFDASLVIDAEPSLATSAEVGDVPLLVPIIEMATIGAGGGSIAWIDAGGALRIGPDSAGADPGPVCYGRGGTEPTFTDAALVTGLLSATNFLGGAVAVDIGAARAAIDEMVARPLGLDVIDAAAGIVALGEAKMATTLEELTLDKGHDPRDFAMVGFGGGGSMVASALASRLGFSKVVIPPSPGTFSAWGMLNLDIVHDFARSMPMALDALRAADVQEQMQALESQARAALDAEGVAPADATLVRSVDLRYEGQEHVLAVPLPDSGDGEFDRERLRADFDERHRTTFGYALGDPAELMAFRIRAVGVLEKPLPPRLDGGDSVDDARVGSRSAVHRESGGQLDWDVYDRGLLPAGARLRGPAIVEETASTTLVSPFQDLEVDRFGNLLITPAGEHG